MSDSVASPACSNADIRSQPHPDCPCCGKQGQPLYAGLRDRLFGTGGSWAISRCSNPGCGLLWLDPMPLAEDIHKAYGRYYTHAAKSGGDGLLRRLFEGAKRGYLANHYGYAEGVSAKARLLGLLPWLYPGRPAELDFSVMWLKAGLRGRLLDVGAGSGWLVEHMNRLGWQAEGLDFDPQTVEAARNRGLVFHLGGLLEQGFRESAYDAVTMSHCIEHVHDPRAWLAEVRRILKPGGRLALATPNSESFCHRWFGESWRGLEPPRHLQLFNRDAMAAVLQEAGFRHFRIWTSIRDANGSFMASRSIRDSGGFDMSASPGGLAKLGGRAVQMLEALLKLAAPRIGEELIVLAEREP